MQYDYANDKAACFAANCAGSNNQILHAQNATLAGINRDVVTMRNAVNGLREQIEAHDLLVQSVAPAIVAMKHESHSKFTEMQQQQALHSRELGSIQQSLQELLHQTGPASLEFKQIESEESCSSMLRRMFIACTPGWLYARPHRSE